MSGTATPALTATSAVEAITHLLYEARKSGDGSETATCAAHAEMFLGSAREESASPRKQIRQLVDSLAELAPAAAGLHARVRDIAVQARVVSAQRSFLVVGLYTDNNQRFATTVRTFTAEAAEDLARKEANAPLEIAAVICDGQVVA